MEEFQTQERKTLRSQARERLRHVALKYPRAYNATTLMLLPYCFMITLSFLFGYCIARFESEGYRPRYDDQGNQYIGEKGRNDEVFAGIFRLSRKVVECSRFCHRYSFSFYL